MYLPQRRPMGITGLGSPADAWAVARIEEQLPDHTNAAMPQRHFLEARFVPGIRPVMGARLSDDALAFVSVDLVHVAHDGDVDVVRAGYVRRRRLAIHQFLSFLTRDQHVAFEDPQGAFTQIGE